MVALGHPYFTPISPAGQVVQKRILSIDVKREQDDDATNGASELCVVYEIANPYKHPVSVTIQSGLALLYQFGAGTKEKKKPELHVVPSTVTDRSKGEILYVADETANAVGTAGVQRIHVGTGIPNYGNAIAVNRTLVPGSSLKVEARTAVPTGVERMILVDAMVDSDRPYGLYPQLLDSEDEATAVPPPIRVYKGANFDANTQRIRLAGLESLARIDGRRGQRSEPDSSSRAKRLYDYLTKIRRRVANRGVRQLLLCTATGVLLATSMFARYALAGLNQAMIVEAGRIAAIVVLALLTAAGVRGARITLAVAFLLSGLFALIQVVTLVIQGSVGSSILLTEATAIPTLYVLCSAIVTLSAPIRSLQTKKQRAE